MVRQQGHGTALVMPHDEDVGQEASDHA
jgi:hypothetical protein